MCYIYTNKMVYYLSWKKFSRRLIIPKPQIIQNSTHAKHGLFLCWHYISYLCFWLEIDVCVGRHAEKGFALDAGQPGPFQRRFAVIADVSVAAVERRWQFGWQRVLEGKRVHAWPQTLFDTCSQIKNIVTRIQNSLVWCSGAKVPTRLNFRSAFSLILTR